MKFQYKIKIIHEIYYQEFDLIHDISSTKIHDKVVNFMSVSYLCQSCWLKKPCLRRPRRAEIIAIDLLRRKKFMENSNKQKYERSSIAIDL